jgi:hypothetical protein
MGNDREWLDGLKEGDEVVLVSHHARRRIARVARVTKTQIVVGAVGMKFRRQDGRMVGGDAWTRSRISKPTPELRARVEEEERHSRALYAISVADFAKMPLERLERIVAIIREEARDG